jgi:hypothetical protein
MLFIERGRPETAFDAELSRKQSCGAHTKQKKTINEMNFIEHVWRTKPENIKTLW